MKTAAKKMSKAEATAAIAAILGSLRSDVDADDVMEAATEAHEYNVALADLVAHHPVFLSEVAEGYHEEFATNYVPTWEEYVRFDAREGEWDLGRWGMPAKPE